MERLLVAVELRLERLDARRLLFAVPAEGGDCAGLCGADLLELLAQGPDDGLAVAVDVDDKHEAIAKPSASSRFRTTFSAACFWHTTSTVSPRPMASATTLTMVWLLPVPGGPSTRRPGAWRALQHRRVLGWVAFDGEKPIALWHSPVTPQERRGGSTAMRRSASSPVPAGGIRRI